MRPSCSIRSRISIRDSGAVFYSFPKVFSADFIKTRAKAGEWNYEDLADSLEIFDKEFDIVNPEVIIGIGQQSYHWLYFLIFNSRGRKTRLKNPSGKLFSPNERSRRL